MSATKTNPMKSLKPKGSPKSVFWSAAALSILVFQQSAFCYYSQGRPKNAKPHCALNNTPELESRLQAGANYTYLTLQPQGQQTFKGSLGGMQALYEFMPMNRFYEAAVFDWKQGNTHSPAGKRSILFLDAHERLGYTFANKNGRLTLFSGLGYHYLRQNLRPKEGSSLRLSYNEFYIPVGFLTSYNASWWFSIGIDFTWMPQVFSTVFIAPLKGAYWNLTNRVDNFYAAMPFTFTLTQNGRFQILLKPFYERWADGHSTATSPSGVKLGLPSNRYNYFGFDVNFGYCF